MNTVAVGALLGGPRTPRAVLHIPIFARSCLANSLSNCDPRQKGYAQQHRASQQAPMSYNHAARFNGRREW
jgi:hypothetical protein